MKIYEHQGFPDPMRVRIALAEKGLTDRVEFVHVEVAKGEHRAPAFLALNPTGTVPVLEVGTTIAECTAITEYLDQLDGDTVLTGRGAKERAVVHMLQRRAESGLLEAVGDYLHHATPGIGPELETYQNRDWGERQRQRAEGAMRYLDSLLADRPYIASDRFTVADITAFAGLAFADFAQVEVHAGCVALREWRGRVAGRPSVAAA
jgi:glutathione S-transferase